MSEKIVAASLQRAQKQAEGFAPAFASVFAAAELQAAKIRRRRLIGVAGVAVASLTFALLSGGSDGVRYIDVDELTASTCWLAPSDVLLPQRQFDIYRELPVLFESTESKEGALL